MRKNASPSAFFYRKQMGIILVLFLFGQFLITLHQERYTICLRSVADAQTVCLHNRLVIIGTTRLNELAKLYGVYDRKETKADRIRRLSDLPEADDIIFNEIAIERYGSVEDMKNAFNKLPEKRKRGRPKKAS